VPLPRSGKRSERLAGVVDWSESLVRSANRFIARQACFHELRDPQLEMQCDLLIHLRLDAIEVAELKPKGATIHAVTAAA
jgi:hypothetical protein